MLIFGMNFPSEISFSARPKLLPVERKLLWGYISSLYYVWKKPKKSKRKKPNTKSEDHSPSDISMESLSIFGSSVLFKSLTNGEPKVRTLVLMQWLQQHCVYAGTAVSFPGHLLPPPPAPSCWCGMVHLKINNFIKNYIEKLYKKLFVTEWGHVCVYLCVNIHISVCASRRNWCKNCEFPRIRLTAELGWGQWEKAWVVSSEKSKSPHAFWLTHSPIPIAVFWP